MKRWLLVWGAATLSLLGAVKPAAAVPNLQVYIEGASWDPVTETWVIGAPDFYVQVIGAHNVIDGVKLAAALVPDTTDPGSGSITLDPVGFWEGPQTAFQYGTPTMGDGDPLPAHGIYPTWYLTLPMGTFTPQYTVYDMQPGEDGSALGEIKRVHVTITGFSRVHFDAYNSVPIGRNYRKFLFAPFSHDAEYFPEPGSLALLSTGLAGAFGLSLRGRRARRRAK